MLGLNTKIQKPPTTEEFCIVERNCIYMYVCVCLWCICVYKYICICIYRYIRIQDDGNATSRTIPSPASSSHSIPSLSSSCPLANNPLEDGQTRRARRTASIVLRPDAAASYVSLSTYAFVHIPCDCTRSLYLTYVPFRPVSRPEKRQIGRTLFAEVTFRIVSTSKRKSSDWRERETEISRGREREVLK